MRTVLWMAVGLECHDAASSEDPMALYDLDTNPLEEHDISGTAEGQSSLN